MSTLKEPGRLAALRGPLIVLLLTIGFYWKLALTDEFVWFDHPDMAYLEIPRLQFQARQIHDGHFPLWDPRIWAGQPLIGQTQPGPLYPLNLLFFLLPLEDGFLRLEFLNWYWVAIHFLAALFCYWLVRDLGGSRAAAILGGCAFSFGGFVGTVAWLDVVNGAVWTPLILMFQLRALRGFRPAASAALSGLFLGIAWLSGHHEIPLMATAAVVITWAIGMFRAGRPDRAAARLAALALVAAALVSAVQTWPTREFGQRSLRWIGLEEALSWNDKIPYEGPAHYSMSARALLGTVLPNQGREADSSPFLGIVVICAAALGLAGCWQDWRIRWLALLGALSLVYSMGALTPLHGVLHSSIPLLDKARIPVRAIHILNFSVAVLAAFGFDLLLERREIVWVRRIAIFAAGFGALIIGGAVFSNVSGRPAPDDGVVLAGFAALMAAAVLLAWRAGRLGRGATVAALGALILIELYGPATSGFSDRHDKKRNQHVGHLTKHKAIASFLFTEPRPVRALVLDQDVPFNFGDWYGIDMIFGYVAGATENVVRHPLHTARTQQLFSITHLVARKPDRPEQQEVFQGADGVKVFRNPDALPRAWAVHETVRAKDWNAMLEMIQDPAFDLARKAVLLESPPALETCAGTDEVKLERHDTDLVVIEATLACRGMVVLSETMYPGWRATVDGAGAPIYTAYGAFRGIVAEGGRHRIVLRYRPTSVYGGFALTMAGLVIVGIAVRRSRG